MLALSAKRKAPSKSFVPRKIPFKHAASTGYNSYPGSELEWNALSAAQQHANRTSRQVKAPVFNGMMLGPSDNRGVKAPKPPKPKRSLNFIRDLMRWEKAGMELAEAGRRRDMNIIVFVSGPVAFASGGSLRKRAKAPAVMFDRVIGVGDKDQVRAKIMSAAGRLAQQSSTLEYLNSSAALSAAHAAFKGPRVETKAMPVADILASVEDQLPGFSDDDGEFLRVEGQSDV